jgi:nucleotide-binding universal stress UspA family protein
MYKHILITTDGSDPADKGVEHGLALAERLKAHVTVLTVVEPLAERATLIAMLGGVQDPASLYDQRIDADMKERFAPIERRAAEHGIAVELLHEVDTSPAEAIVRTAQLKHCDLIVMSSHGRRGGFKRLLLGSQTTEVLVHTAIPVLVIR